MFLGIVSDPELNKSNIDIKYVEMIFSCISCKGIHNTYKMEHREMSVFCEFYFFIRKSKGYTNTLKIVIPGLVTDLHDDRRRNGALYVL